MFRALTTLASPGGARAKLSAFMFHRVLASAEAVMPEEPDATGFARLLDWICGQFRVLEPLEACRRLVAGSLPARSAILTFDDGYRDNLEVALPLLSARSLPAAFFIASGFSHGAAMFNDRIIYAIRDTRRSEVSVPWLPQTPIGLESLEAKRAAIDLLIATVKHCPDAERAARVEAIVQATEADAPAGLMMNPEQLGTLAAAGMTIGGHTRTHPILQMLPADQARQEIEQGRRDLEERVGVAPLLFAYPNGRPGVDFGPEHGDMVKRAGFEFAFSTHPGASSRATDPLQLRRFTPWDRTPVRFAMRSLLNLAR